MTIAVIRLDAPGYCACGCGSKTSIARMTRNRLGHVRGQPVRFVVGHVRRRSPVPFIEEMDTNCWIWQHQRNRNGYGVTKRQGKTALAHRVLFEELCGWLPAELDHLCRNPACVNPGHLEAVSHRENMRRGLTNISGINARKTHCIRGHAFDEANTRIGPDGRRACRACARAYQMRRYYRNKAQRVAA